LYKVAIIGAGAIGSAMAAHLSQRGHSVGLWSRSFAAGAGEIPTSRSLTTTGAVEGTFEVDTLTSMTQLGDYQIVVVALPATAYADVLPELARHLAPHHHVVFSGSLSLAPLWLSDMAAQAGAAPVITAWGTTLLGAHFQPDGTLYIPFIRKSFALASLPATQTPASLALCRDLFGIAFEAAPSILDVNLSNINPVAHAGQLIINFSRIDRAEKWKLFDHFTESGVRVAEALDEERIALAAAFGAETRSLRRHYALSYPVSDADVVTMVRQISSNGSRTLGPASLEHRYLVEDMPYGLAFLERLAGHVDVKTPALTAAITLLEIMSGLDIRKGNRFLDAVLPSHACRATIIDRCRG
jgi:opine dehydrogenase